jgi:probable rRNA maturation factor
MIYLRINDGLLASGEPALANSAVLERAASETLRFASASDLVELTIVIEGDEALAGLNREYLGIDAPTDVLSFPANELDPDTGASYLGDVLISYPRARTQAEAGGHSTADELQLLIVHGVLHLLSYDHADPPEKEAMWAAQAEILRRLGCQITAPPA